MRPGVRAGVMAAGLVVSTALVTAQESPGYVMITYEMVHDTRVIPIGAGPADAE